MGAMKRLHDDLEHGSVLITADEFSDGETTYGLIEITTALGHIRISGRELLARFVDIDDIATDDLEAFPGIDRLGPPPSVVVTHNDEVVMPKPANKIGGYEK